MYWKDADQDRFCRISLYPLYVLKIPTHSSVLDGFTMLAIPNLCDNSCSSFRRSCVRYWLYWVYRTSGGVSHLTGKNYQVTRIIRAGEKIPTQSGIVLCVRILKIPTLSGLFHLPCPPIAFESLPRRSMKIYTIVLTMLALSLVLFPCLVTSNGGDVTQLRAVKAGPLVLC